MTTELTTTEASGTMTPMQLIAVAIQHDADPDRLEKLMALQERYEANQAEKAFAEAMHAAQAEMPRIVRDAFNKQTKSKYAVLETVQVLAGPVYQKHGFSLSFGEADCPVERHKRTTCEVRHSQGACHTYHIDLPVDGIGPKGTPIGAMNAVQGAISTTTYGQRRLLCMIFNLTIAGEDDDGAGVTTPIDSEQIGTLNRILDRIPPDDSALKDMLAWAGVDSIEKLPASKFTTAQRALEAKAAKYE